MEKIKYVPVIGLEVHIELKTKTKMFCPCLNDTNEKHPNINVCPVCFGHPGTLPVINREAVKNVLKLGLALNGEIPDFSRFDRKHYFYPDLPKGYQISQYQYPLVLGGHLEISATDEKPGDKNFQFSIFNFQTNLKSEINPKPQINPNNQIQNYKKIRLTRIHLEEDTGRLEHKDDSSLVNLNRAGVPLMELVTEPDMESAEEAKKFAEELRLIILYLNISSASMEKGEMRVEANISLKKENDEKLGTKVEIKNLNSFKALQKAVEYEIKRQMEILEKGEKVIQETRGFNDTKEITFSERNKEEAEDYRYFPEPDLPPLKVKKIFDLEELKNSVPELPKEKRQRFKKDFKIKDEQIEIIISDKALADYFENIVSELVAWNKTETTSGKEKAEIENMVQLAVNYFTSDLLGIMKEKFLPIEDLRITPENFAELIKMTAKNEVSSRGAKDILLQMVETGEDPSDIAEKMNLTQENNETALSEIAGKIIAENPKARTDYKNENQNSLQFLVGQMMKETHGKANPQIAAKIIKKILES